MAQSVLNFGRFRLDIRRRELTRDGQAVTLGSRALDILIVLAEAKGEVVSKDTLLERVWPGVVVEENNIHVHVSALRKVFEGETNCIVTVPGRGYRLIGFTEATEPGGLLGPEPTPPNAPTIAVLPFQNLSGDQEQEYFVDGIVEEITTALSRIRWLVVIARNSSSAHRGEAIDAKRVGTELGARYVMEGSVRKAAHRIRITVQLIDTKTGAHLWADRFDGTVEDIFELQDRVAIGVAGVIEPTLQTIEAARIAHRPTNDLTAYDLYLRGYAMAMSLGARFFEALDLMEQAIARDPRYAPALAWAALGCSRLIMDGRSSDPASDKAKGTDYARRALQAGSDDPAVIVNAAAALALFGEDIDAMIRLISRALALNPNFARGWHLSGMLYLHAGRLDTAIEHIRLSLNLSPRTRVGWGHTWIGAAHFFARRFNLAREDLHSAIQEDHSFPAPYQFLAACYAQMGQLDNARSIMRRVCDICPVTIPDASYLRVEEHRNFFLDGLRKAAGMET